MSTVTNVIDWLGMSEDSHVFKHKNQETLEGLMRNEDDIRRMEGEGQAQQHDHPAMMDDDLRREHKEDDDMPPERKESDFDPP
jgi:hypothetical protein